MEKPFKCKSETVLKDMRTLTAKNNGIWDRFAPVYSGFVTGTPGNKRAYEAMYKRIRTMVKDKEVLELATGPGVIAKQVANESKRMVATDFSEKMLAVARRAVRRFHSQELILKPDGMRQDTLPFLRTMALRLIIQNSWLQRYR